MKTLRILLAVLSLAGAGTMLTVPSPAKAEAGPRVIEVHAKRFGFTPNLVTVKKGETVRIELISEDVTHGFFSKPLKLDEIIAPGTATEITLTPPAAGKFTVICDHFCGSGHGNMGMNIVVEE